MLRFIKKVLVSVKDYGFGINVNDLNKLFDRYYRVEGLDTKFISGFGSVYIYLQKSSSGMVAKFGQRA